MFQESDIAPGYTCICIQSDRCDRLMSSRPGYVNHCRFHSRTYAMSLSVRLCELRIWFLYIQLCSSDCVHFNRSYHKLWEFVTAVGIQYSIFNLNIQLFWSSDTNIGDIVLNMRVLVPRKDPLAPRRRKLALIVHFYLCVYCAHKFSVFDWKTVCLWFSSVLQGTVLESKGSVYDGLGVVDTFLVELPHQIKVIVMLCLWQFVTCGLGLRRDTEWGAHFSNFYY